MRHELRKDVVKPLMGYDQHMRLRVCKDHFTCEILRQSEPQPTDLSFDLEYGSH
jgi:hypothetical protein